MDQTIVNPEQNDQRAPNIRNVCFYSFNFQDALSHLRLVGPANHLGLKVIYGVENGQVFPDRAQMGDVIVLQRDFPRAFEAYQAILKTAKSKQIPLVLDIDDLLFELPDDHPDRLQHNFSATLLPTFLAMLEADLITVTTHALRDYVIDFNKNVVVLANYLDDLLWQPKTPSLTPQPDSKIKRAHPPTRPDAYPAGDCTTIPAICWTIGISLLGNPTPRGAIRSPRCALAQRSHLELP
jgi:hypothetical protein